MFAKFHKSQPNTT